MNRAPCPAPRLDPRRRALITPAGLRRIVLGSQEGDASAKAGLGAAAAPRPLRSAGPFTRCIAVAVRAERGALDDHAREAIAAAALLADATTEVAAAVFGDCGEDFAALGIDRVAVWPGFEPLRYAPGRCVDWLLAWHERWAPSHWLMPDRDADGDIGRRFAVARCLSLACHVVELEATRLRQRAGPREDALRPLAQVMLVARQVATPDLPFVGAGRTDAGHPVPKALPEASDFEADTVIEDLGTEPGDPQTVALEEADLILAAGNGVTDLALFQSLATALGAATGASRVAVDDGRFPRGKQIGATGKSVSASTYLALGISGAVQHLQGIKDCRHVIAVNLDASAPIARRATLTLVEDSRGLMQALLELVAAAKTGAVA